MGQQEDKLILALDISSKSTGWAIGTAEGELKAHGLITANDKNFVPRIKKLRKGLLELLQNNPTIERVVAEEVRLDGFNTNTSKILTYCQFALHEAIYDFNPSLDYEFIQANSWRAKIGIKTGRGIKRQTLKAADIEYVKNKYSLEVGDDEADAIGIYDSCFVKKNYPYDEPCAW